jgi:hypothetical protein
MTKLIVESQNMISSFGTSATVKVVDFVTFGQTVLCIRTCSNKRAQILKT